MVVNHLYAKWDDPPDCQRVSHVSPVHLSGWRPKEWVYDPSSERRAIGTVATVEKGRKKKTKADCGWWMSHRWAHVLYPPVVHGRPSLMYGINLAIWVVCMDYNLHKPLIIRDAHPSVAMDKFGWNLYCIQQLWFYIFLQLELRPKIAPLEEGKNQHEQTKPRSKSDSTICVCFIAMHKGVNWKHIICFIGAMTDTPTVGWMKLSEFSVGSKIWGLTNGKLETW